MFEVTWPTNERGTHACVGVATDKQILHGIGELQGRAGDGKGIVFLQLFWWDRPSS